jgi:hypothetical protein
MGNIYNKSYFPSGYGEWISETGLQNQHINYDDPMNQEIYDKYITDNDYRDKIKEIAKHYTDSVDQIKNDKELFLSGIEGIDSTLYPRVLYDYFVGKTFSDFWLNLIDQPRESIQKYYRDNVPNVEQTFYLVEKEYGNIIIFPASDMISIYRQYT